MSEYTAHRTARQGGHKSGQPVIHPWVGAHDLRGSQGRPVQHDSLSRRDGDSGDTGGLAGAHSLAKRAYARATIGGSAITAAIGIAYVIIRVVVR